MSEFINDKPLEYHSDLGTVFKSTKSDMSTGLEIIKPKLMTKLEFAQDMFEFGCYFSAEVMPKLNGFRGFNLTNYATIRDQGE